METKIGRSERRIGIENFPGLKNGQFVGKVNEKTFRWSKVGECET